jgi:transcription initiation factor TFIIIB Brf1 subunit/transcription initiation factor TFIIB
MKDPMDTLKEDIWRDLEEILKENELNTICNSEMGACLCNHINKVIDTKEGIQVCLDCGTVINNPPETCEWNNFKKEDGSFQTSGQRADIYSSDNPYDSGGSVPGFNKYSFAMKLHYQQVFSHKQKTFWKISEKLQDYCTLMKIPSIVLSDAKNMWHICMESGKLTRASVRNGLISACLFYSCINNNVHIDRQKIIDHTDGNQRGFLKGEKIFLEIMNKHGKFKSLSKEKTDIKENDSFVKFCNILELPFNVSNVCNEIYTKNIDNLDSVTPKSAIAGILYYTVKNKLKLKCPSKSKISQTVNVCIPTINKVVLLLEE